MKIITVVGMLLCSSVYSQSFNAGTGEPNSPFEIRTAEQLMQIGSDSSLMTKSYVLESDIDLDPNLPGGGVFRGAVISGSLNEGHSTQSDSYVAIVQDVAVAVFSGTFSGNGHSIRNMIIDAPDGKCIGLFAYIGDDAIVDGLQIEGACVLGRRHVGLLGGINHGTVSQCNVSGSVSGNSRIGGLIGSNAGYVDCSRSKARVAGEDMVGGLIGHALARSSITSCCSSCDVTGLSDIGGLVGEMLPGMVICCCTSGKVSSRTNAGGLIGDGPCGGTVSMCNSSALVRGTIIGGLVGIAQQADIKNSYATGVLTKIKPGDLHHDLVVGAGGLVGYWKASQGNVISCCWDMEVSGVDVAVGCSAPDANLNLILTKGVATEQMKTATSLVSRSMDF